MAKRVIIQEFLEETDVQDMISDALEGVDSGHVGLGNVDNTSDMDKPVSTAQQQALDEKADLDHTHLVSEITDITDVFYTEDEVDTLLGEVLPDQSGNSGNHLVTDGVSAHWAPPPDVLVTSVAGKTGDVALTTGDIDDTGSTRQFVSPEQIDLIEGAAQAADLGSAAFAGTGDFATAAQGALAESAVQSSQIADFETSGELDARDAANRSRSNHTGTQGISTVDGLQSALGGKVSQSALGDLAYEDAVSVADIEATGTPSASTVLHGDGAWRQPSGGGSGGGVQSVVAGDNIAVDDTDPANPVVSAQVGDAPVTSVAGKVGDVELGISDVTLPANGRMVENGGYLSFENGAHKGGITLGESYASIYSGEEAGEEVLIIRPAGSQFGKNVTVKEASPAEDDHLTRKDYVDAQVQGAKDYADAVGGGPELAGDGEADTAARSDHQHKGAGNFSVVLGPDAFSGISGVAAGYKATAGASGSGHIAIGPHTEANANAYAVAIGSGAKARSSRSIALGMDADTDGRLDHFQVSAKTMRLVARKAIGGESTAPGAIEMYNAANELVSISVNENNEIVATPV